MRPVSNLSTIISNYDAILMDLWGVVHDGSHLYPGVREAMEQLKWAQKKIIMLSNAPRRAHKAEVVLNKLGIAPEQYVAVVTSGEVGYQWLAQYSSPRRGEAGRGAYGNTESDNAPSLTLPLRGRGYFYIGPLKDADVLDGLSYERVDDVEIAHFLLNVGFGSEEESSENWQPVLRAAQYLQLPMLCLNPDFEVVKISGERYACAGVLAADYEKLGGTVKYFGKPFPEVYQHCLGLLAPVKKERILAIGDGIATDIAGAVNFGVDAALVTGGIVKKDEHRVEELCRTFNAIPKYVMPALIW